MIWSYWLYLERSTSYKIPDCASLPSFASFWSRCSSHHLILEDTESVICLKWHTQTVNKTWGQTMECLGCGIRFQTQAGVLYLPYSILRICPWSPSSRLCSRWVGSSRWVTRPGSKVYYLCMEPTLRMLGALLRFSHTYSWRAAYCSLRFPRMNF
jgi:hypothetical protein